MRQALTLIVLVVGCRSTEERCAAISSQQFFSGLDEDIEKRFQGDLLDSLRATNADSNWSADPTMGDRLAAFARGLRAREAYRSRQEDPQKYPELAKMPPDSADSFARASDPPPRPSDWEWYAEHCHDGHAR